MVPCPDKNGGAGSEIQQPSETDAGRSNVSAESAKDVGAGVDGGASCGVVRDSTEKSNPFASAQGDDAATSLKGGNQQSSCMIAVKEDSARTIEAGLLVVERSQQAVLRPTQPSATKKTF